MCDDATRMPKPRSPFPFKPPAPFRFVGAVFGLVFAAVGFIVIFSLWFGEMGNHAPVFFRLVGSLIACAFMAMGGTLAFSSITGFGAFGAARLAEQMQKFQSSSTPLAPGAGAPGSYLCPHCGAALARVDVSPLGDTKCAFCGGWFNIHRK